MRHTAYSIALIACVLTHGQLRLTPGITSNVTLHFKLLEYPHVSLASPAFIFQGGTSYLP